MSPATDAAAGLVLVERRERAALVTLNRPDAANALSKDLVSGLEAVFGELAALIKKGDDLRAVVLTGAGKAFSAGADLKERRAMTLEQTWAFPRRAQSADERRGGVPAAGRSRRSTASPSAAGSSWRWRATCASPPTPRSSG